MLSGDRPCCFRRWSHVLHRGGVHLQISGQSITPPIHFLRYFIGDFFRFALRGRKNKRMAPLLCPLPPPRPRELETSIVSLERLKKMWVIKNANNSRLWNPFFPPINFAQISPRKQNPNVGTRVLSELKMAMPVAFQLLFCWSLMTQKNKNPPYVVFPKILTFCVHLCRHCMCSRFSSRHNFLFFGWKQLMHCYWPLYESGGVFFHQLFRQVKDISNYISIFYCCYFALVQHHSLGASLLYFPSWQRFASLKNAFWGAFFATLLCLWHFSSDWTWARLADVLFLSILILNAECVAEVWKRRLYSTKVPHTYWYVWWAEEFNLEFDLGLTQWATLAFVV